MRSHDHAGSGPVEIRNSSAFTGLVWAEALLPHEAGVGVNRTTFAPRSRTRWHRHEGGQILIGHAGAGLVATRDGDLCRIAEGVAVHGAPGEEHWHGALPDSFMTHVSVGLSGGTEWLDEVSDDEYDSAVRRIADS